MTELISDEFAAVDKHRRKPFTMRERRAWSQDFGRRHVNNWGAGDLPAPFCAGDVVCLTVKPDTDLARRLRGQEGPFFVVTYGPSIDEGDAWYFRVRDGSIGGGSDRLHVAYKDRSGFDTDLNWMADFDLVETVDAEGLAERERMLAAGWCYHPPLVCDTCGQRLSPARLTARPGAVDG